jgi:hypothetical protein
VRPRVRGDGPVQKQVNCLVERLEKHDVHVEHNHGIVLRQRKRLKLQQLSLTAAPWFSSQEETSRKHVL